MVFDLVSAKEGVTHVNRLTSKGKKNRPEHRYPRHISEERNLSILPQVRVSK